MSPLELVDDRFEKLAQELRAARPVATAELRERVRGLAPPPRRRFDLDFRRLVPAAGAATLVAAVGVAVVLGIVHGSTNRQVLGRASTLAPQQRAPHGAVAQGRPTLSQNSAGGLNPTAGRLQQYDAFLRLRLRNSDELSRQTQDAMEYTHRVGGYVEWARYGAPGKRDASELALRIPIQHVQAAIAHFAGYGSLLRQRVVIKDLQNRVDNLAGRIRLVEADIARTEQQLAGSLTPEQRQGLGQRLRDDRMRVAALRSQSTNAVTRARFARVGLTMVTGKKPAAASSRFHRTMHEAGSVLLRELEILLYALIVAGPLLVLGALAIAAARARRRRADWRLLERS
ncbi:MAG: DUF4349 domain-containing protein [Gaiellaceae bacterium]